MPQNAVKNNGVRQAEFCKRVVASLKRRFHTTGHKAANAWRSFDQKVRPGTLAIMYHRVKPPTNDPQGLAVSPENFEAQIRWLQKNRRLLKISEFAEILGKNLPFPPDGRLITFDDGYTDNFHTALPILEKLNAEAIFFVSTGLIGTKKEFWWDELDRIFLQGDTPPTLKIKTAADFLEFSTRDRFERAKAYRQFHKILKPLSETESGDIIGQLQHWQNLPADGREENRVMTPEELKRLAASKSAEVGVHSHNHLCFTNLTAETAESEIIQSKKIIEEITGKKTRFFSFPFGGKKDFTATNRLQVSDCGFSAAFASFPGVIRKSARPFALPRVAAVNRSDEEFMKSL